MALSFDDFPYNLTPRGQKVLFILSSTNAAQPGFKYGVSVTETSTGKVYFFYYSPALSDLKLYFDLAPLVALRNSEAVNNIHSGTTGGTYTEPIGAGWEEYSLTFTEWWLVSGVLTENEAVSASDDCKVFNAYYQPSDGYKPNANGGANNVRFAVYGGNSYLMSDRKQTTYIWPEADTYGAVTNGIYTPAFANDYGLLYCPGQSELSNNQASYVRIRFYDGVNPTPITASYLMGGTEIDGIPCYPGNLEINTVGFPIPSAYPDWTHYILDIRNKAQTTTVSYPYVFFNADKFGLKDCRFDVVRLAWVGSRGGWDYFNFTKRSENSYNLERRQWRQVLPNEYLTSSRQQTDRQAIVTKVLTVTSDWIQEGEFEFLKNLFISNQVQIVNEDGTQTPVSIAETNYVARRERTGRLFNITVKINYSQEYWS